MCLNSCYHGRVFDNDMKQNDAQVPFVDDVTIRNCSTCCVTFIVSNCCNRHGDLFTIADGTCGTEEMCHDEKTRRDLCSKYGSDECRHDACTSSDLCNTLDKLS